ncbi:hypothetical protein HZH66_009874 [Vespula vulgaris]|uniref:4-hydroxybenzoate polyprenyltransferase, mitochondrial n=1 Tax=Vespula vulgaris TaxID=7454 RepID=A0A834JR38_VESVU|nr:hypothetical protein HZH66_009874 [Vespula vulgaris]
MFHSNSSFIKRTFQIRYKTMLLIRGGQKLGAFYGLSTYINNSNQKQIKIALSSLCSFKNFSTLSSIKIKYKYKIHFDIDDKVKPLLGLNTLCYINLSNCQERRYSGLAARILNNSSPKIQPYMRLMRIDKPIGSWLLFWPCGWSIAMAAPPSSRTKDRPLATGQLTYLQSLIFLGGQLSLGLLVLLQLNWYSVLLGASSLGLVIIYPLMKRITYWPQFILGMTFNWGALLGWSAVRESCDWSVCLPLYAAGVCWTIIYDTIYAHQDKVDDLLLSIKSTALKFGDKTQLYLSAFGITMIAGLITSGIVTAQTWPYYVAVGLTGKHLVNQICTLDINNPKDCAQKFISNQRIGMMIFVGIILSNLLKDLPKKQDQKNKQDGGKDCIK